MVQFNEKDLNNFKDKLKKNNSIIGWLQEQVNDLITSGIKVPEAAIATWIHYYYCPKHSVKLNFDINNSEEYVCPIDGEILSGEPYGGAWWRNLNDLNAKGCHYFALLWIFTKQDKYLKLAEEILLKYAKCYPGYKIHGDIPYNGPGKANAQTICDALWISELAYGYDLVKDSISPEVTAFIEKNLFLCCAEFLKEHRSRQIHNHEVIIGAAIGIIGILLHQKELIDFAINERYGLKYQLQNAVLKDNFWFEGSVSYHNFALHGFFTFEKFACNTNFGMLKSGKYREMLKLPFKLMEPDLTFPSINDGFYSTGVAHLEYLYEFAYRQYGDEEFCWYLNKCYEKSSRSDNLEAFLYGTEDLPKAKEKIFENYHGDGSGITVLRGTKDRYLLFKHGPYGGEHDHYDRLGISFLAYKKRISPDLGTTGYGAILHYDYYKNTGSHNTVVINEDNQPPANTKVLKYEVEHNSILVEAETKWDDTYKTLDSYTEVQWKEESYNGVTMRRTIKWCDNYFVEVFRVEGVRNKTIDWVFHVAGELKENYKCYKYQGAFSKKVPFKYIKNIRSLKVINTLKSSWNIGDTEFHLYSYCTNKNNVFYGEGSDNPSTKNISYIINRVIGAEVIFANVFEVCNKDEGLIKNVSFDINASGINVIIEERNGKINSVVLL